MRQYSRIVGAVLVAWGTYGLVVQIVVPLFAHHIQPIDSMLTDPYGFLLVLVGVRLLQRRAWSWWIALIISCLFTGLCGFGVIWHSVKYGWTWIHHGPIAVWLPVATALLIVGLLLDSPSKWRAQARANGSLTNN